MLYFQSKGTCWLADLALWTAANKMNNMLNILKFQKASRTACLVLLLYQLAQNYRSRWKKVLPEKWILDVVGCSSERMQLSRDERLPGPGGGQKSFHPLRSTVRVGKSRWRATATTFRRRNFHLREQIKHLWKNLINRPCTGCADHFFW